MHDGGATVDHYVIKRNYSSHILYAQQRENCMRSINLFITHSHSFALIKHLFRNLFDSNGMHIIYGLLGNRAWFYFY